MHLAEPMTVATDYVLALLAWWLGRRLWAQGAGADDPRRWWAAAFWLLGLAAFLGGTAHGVAPLVSPWAQSLLWRSTMVAIGSGAVLLVQALVVLLEGAGWWRWLLGVEWALYVLWVCGVDSDFRYAVLEYATALVAVLVVHLGLAWRGRAGAWSVVAGVLVSFGAAGIQQAGWAPHPSFNHNDLYHVVQMAGLLLLYHGAVRIGPATKTPTRT